MGNKNHECIYELVFHIHRLFFQFALGSGHPLTLVLARALAHATLCTECRGFKSHFPKAFV